MKWRIKIDFPFDWKLKLKFFILPNRPTPCIIKENKWMRAIRINNRILPIIVSNQKNFIIIETTSINEKEKKKIEKLILECLGIKDARRLYNFMEKDEILKKIKKKLYGFGRAGYMAITVYEGVIKAILQQQISLRVAENIIANLVEKFGDKTKFQNELIYGFPLPYKLVNASIEELRKCGLSYRKAEYVKEFSKEVLNGFDVEKLRNKKPEEIMEILTSFKGIGRWTAELVMIATLGKNIIPADDLGVRKAISFFYFNNKLQSPEKIREFARRKFDGFLRDVLVYLLMAYRMEK